MRSVINPRPEPESFATVLMLWFMSSREGEGEKRETEMIIAYPYGRSPAVEYEVLGRGGVLL